MLERAVIAVNERGAVHVDQVAEHEAGLDEAVHLGDHFQIGLLCR